MDNTIDDAKFDEILKQNNVTPIVEGADPWADFGPVTPEPSFMDTVKSRASAVAEDPVEAGKGFIKNALETAQDVSGMVESVGRVIPKAIGLPGAETAGMATPQEKQLIQEQLTPTNEAQKGGANIETAAELYTVGKDIAVGGAKMLGKGIAKTGEYLAERGATKEANFIKDLITPELTQTKGINAIKTGKVAEGGVLKNRDITEAVPFFEDTVKAVSEVPGISKSKTLLENNNAIHDHIGTIAEDLKSQIKGKGFFSPNEFNGYMKDVSTKLEEVPSLTRDAVDVANKYLNQFNKLVKQNGYTPEGLLQARKEFDKLLPNKQLSPDIENGITEAVRAIRQGANDFLASKVPDVAVKEMLAKQTSLYNAIENIAPKAFKEGSSGFKRWVKAHPKIVGTAKILGTAGVGGGTAGALLNQ